MGICEDMLTLISETNKFIGDMPDAPNNLICIYDTGGFDPEFQLNKSVIERLTFMIKLRDTSYTSAISRCEAIKLALNALTNITLNSRLYIEVFQVGGMNLLGKDEKNRWLYSMNFKVRLVK